MKGHFLQSKEWEEFQRSLGREVFRVDGMLTIKLSLALGKNYLYCAGVSSFAISQFRNFQKLAGQHNAIFLKVEPMSSDAEFAQKLHAIGFVKSKKEVQPQRTIVLDITKSEDELLAAMHNKTRYNIRLAQTKKLGIKNYESRMSHAVSEEFFRLLQKTAGRDRFSSHSKKYYEKFLELPIVRLFAAECLGKSIAANMVLFYEDVAYYLHGASDYGYRAKMAPYLLHWRTIKYAKEQGYKAYDLWGIDEKKWPGITRFKRGLGGQDVEYIGSYDYVFQPFWYKLYGLYRNLKPKT